MSRFATKTPDNTVSNAVVNHEGAKAYTLTKENELLGAVVTNFLSDSFYESADTRLIRIKELVKDLASSNPWFVLGLSVYVRTVYNMRTMSHILIGELTRYFNGQNSNFSDLIEDSISRVDDIVEVLAYLIPEAKKNKSSKKGTLTHSTIKGLAKAFEKFDEYQLSKYDKDYAINLKDVIRMVHPNTPLAKKILNGELVKADTWERIISAIPKNSENYDKSVYNAWKDMLSNKKLWYMAAIRNLRNIIEASIRVGDDEAVELLCSFISNEKAVANSKQMPFRFLSAYKSVPVWTIYTKKVKSALSKAALYSVKNVAISDKIAVFADVSSSMTRDITEKSSIRHVDIALLYAGIAANVSDYSVSGIFGDYVRMKDSEWVFGLYESYTNSEVGYSTNGYLAIDELTKTNTFVDTVMFFSDDQMYNSEDDISSVEKSLKIYMEKINPKVRCFIFDVWGYGTKVSNMKNVFLVQGWSDKVFEYVNALQSYTNDTTVNEITELGKKYLK